MKKVQRFPVRQSQLGTVHRGGLTAGETVLLLGTVEFRSLRCNLPSY